MVAFPTFVQLPCYPSYSWASSKTFHFSVLAIISLTLSLATYQIIRFAPKLWDYLTLNLLFLDLVSYLLFDGLIECNYCVETINNSLIFFLEVGWGVF